MNGHKNPSIAEMLREIFSWICWTHVPYAYLSQFLHPVPSHIKFDFSETPVSNHGSSVEGIYARVKVNESLLELQAKT